MDNTKRKGGFRMEDFKPIQQVFLPTNLLNFLSIVEREEKVYESNHSDRKISEDQ